MQSCEKQGKYVKKFYRWGKSVPWLTKTTKTILVTRSVPVRPKWVTHSPDRECPGPLLTTWPFYDSLTHSLPSIKGRTWVTLCYYCTRIFFLSCHSSAPSRACVWVKSLDSNFRSKFFSLFNCCKCEPCFFTSYTPPVLSRYTIRQWVPADGYAVMGTAWPADRIESDCWAWLSPSLWLKNVILCPCCQMRKWRMQRLWSHWRDHM